MDLDIDNPLVVFKSDESMLIMDRAETKVMTFEKWLDQIEGFGTRRERLLDDWAADCSPLPWLEAAWEEAYKQGYKDCQATVKQMEDK